MLSDSNLKITSEKVEEHNSTPTADDIFLDSSSKLDEKRTDHGEMVKVLPPLSSALSLPVPCLTLTPLPSLFSLSMVSLQKLQ
jgi:hypothetical protein